MAAPSLLSSSNTRYKVCLFRILPSRNDILNEHGFAIQCKWERDTTGPLSGNTAALFPTTATRNAPPPPDFSSLAATLGTTLTTPVTNRRALNSEAPNNNNSNTNATESSSTSFDRSGTCKIELTDYNSFWRGTLTRQDWESQRDPTFEASIYEKWTRAAFSGLKKVDGYMVALTARKTYDSMTVTWTVSKQDGTGEKRNLLGSITLTPSYGDRQQLWADWTLNTINERDRFQLQLSSLQKRMERLEQLAMTSQAMLETIRQERNDDKSDLLEKVRALINSKKTKIKSLVNRNKLLESELEALKTQVALRVQPEAELDVKIPDKGKRRGKTPAPKSNLDKTPAASQESVLAGSDLGFMSSTIPRSQRTMAAGKRARPKNDVAIPSPPSDPMFSDLVIPDMNPSDNVSQDPFSSYNPPSDPLSSISSGSHRHLTPSTHLSLMDRISQAASSQSSRHRRRPPHVELEAFQHIDDDEFADDDKDGGATGALARTTVHEKPNHTIKGEGVSPRPIKTCDAVAGTIGTSTAASVLSVDPNSLMVAKYKRGIMSKQLGAVHPAVQVKQEEQQPQVLLPSSPIILQAYSDKDSPTSGVSSDDLLPKRLDAIPSRSSASKSGIPRPTTPTTSSILSSARRLPTIGKKMLTTGGNTTTRMRALEKHKASQLQAQGGNSSDRPQQHGDITSSTFSVSSSSLANQSGAFSPDSSMDNSRISVTSLGLSPNAGGAAAAAAAGAAAAAAFTSGTKRGSDARSPRSDVKRTRRHNAAAANPNDSLLLPDTEELFKRLQ